MNNSKDIVPFWNKARQAMDEISSLLEEAEKETLKKLTPLVPWVKFEKDGKNFLLSDFDINFGTLGQRIDLYFFSPVGCTERISKLVHLKDKSAKSLTDEELADLQILKKLSEGKTSSLQAYNQLEEIEGVIIRARINPTIEEIQTIVESDRVPIQYGQATLLCAVGASLTYKCSMRHKETFYAT